MSALTILYRGPLGSCNFDCPYCPFAKRSLAEERLDEDQLALQRFVEACRTVSRELRILMTPWGEALVHRHVQRGIAELSQLAHVQKVAIQTNLSGSLAWLSAARCERVGIWASHHPSEQPTDRFLERCQVVVRAGVSMSAGVVGLREHLAVARRLRADLPERVHVWVNAWDGAPPGYYDAALRDAFQEIDPLFGIGVDPPASQGHACRTGASAISVDGEGEVRRCHFVPERLGNLYRDRLEDMLAERPCPNRTCDCFIGYVHLDRLGLYDVLGAGVLERAWEDRRWACSTG